MDIEGLGPSVIENLVNAGLVNVPWRLVSHYLRSRSRGLERMGKKSAQNLISAIEKSKQNDLSKLLCAFGIRQVGAEVRHWSWPAISVLWMPSAAGLA